MRKVAEKIFEGGPNGALAAVAAVAAADRSCSKANEPNV
jgi:hypothetical protein